MGRLTMITPKCMHSRVGPSIATPRHATPHETRNPMAVFFRLGSIIILQYVFFYIL